MKNFDLLQGDCLELMRELPDASVDLVLCDLPYGTTACAWDSVIPFDALWGEYRRIAKQNAAIVLTASQPFTSALVMSNPKMFRHEWVWNKSRAANFASAKRAPLKKHESVLVFSSGAVRYYPRMEQGQEYKERRQTRKPDGIYGAASIESPDGWVGEIRGMRYPGTVLQFGSMRQQDLLHPTQKPVALMEYLIRTYTNEGDLVLDNCMGSGTTGVACASTGRRFIGMEMDADYFEIASKRIAEVFSPAPAYVAPQLDLLLA